ncbi:unknown [Feldmannia species virus]|uniref:Uncharacterized protein n=1 Tax=Feldmannia species virus TaxID=39420 RepID=B5LWL2_9PHYC|nr:hypothetical protein FeldSpV_gp123 [Feldmannia species virus]ACH46875.1 unknown [Feldmannia species virus]
MDITFFILVIVVLLFLRRVRARVPYVEIGDAYAHGNYPHRFPNRGVAARWYLKGARQSRDPVCRGLCASRLGSLRETLVFREDHAGVPMEPNLNTRNTRDSQNSHDHGVVTALVQNLKKLGIDFKSSSREFREADEVVAEAVEFCTSMSLPDEDVNKILRVLHSISQTDPSRFRDTDFTQINVLDMVLWKIATVNPDDVRSNMRETLLKRLASGVEGDSVVCGTGRMGRILSVFEGTDNFQKSVSIDVVSQEIARAASRIRSEVLDRATKEERQAYENGTSPDPISKTMSEKLGDEARKLYIEDLKMHPNVVEPLLEVYSGAF